MIHINQTSDLIPFICIFIKYDINILMFYSSGLSKLYLLASEVSNSDYKWCTNSVCLPILFSNNETIPANYVFTSVDS